VRVINALEINPHAKDALIVGGGHSARHFDFAEWVDADVYAINEYEGFRPDYLIYQDDTVKRRLKSIVKDDTVQIISDKDAIITGVDYYYKKRELHPAFIGTVNTGAIAIMLCHKIGYSRIYLIGFDGTTDSCGISHYYGDKVGEGEKYLNEKKLEIHLEKDLHFFKGAMQTINKCVDNVYNLSMDSVYPFPKIKNKELENGY